MHILLKGIIDFGAEVKRLTKEITGVEGRLDKLRKRIVELEAENRAERANFKELHKVRSRLERVKVQREAQISALAKWHRQTACAWMLPPHAPCGRGWQVKHALFARCVQLRHRCF